MGPRTRVLLAWCVIALLGASCRGMNFENDFNILWQAENNILAQNTAESVDLTLTKAGGANFESSQPYLYGSFSVRIKLIPGESAGTVAAFYLMSFTDYHDEIDFEFLGNETGQPYTLHTNIFVNGTGGREQRVKLWFDPTADFHTYKVVWNHYQVLWLVDEIPIRFYRNLEHIYPGSYPHFQPLVVSACLFDGSLWATQDGTKPVLWDHAPFTVKFSNFQFEACKVPRGTDPRACDKDYEGNWWEGVYYQSLDQSRRDQLMWVTANWKIYDYCYDSKRYVPMPLECEYNVPWVW
ncbi:unnamed protein product [Calypogeia fissa]